jgi:perosamine synthetase
LALLASGIGKGDKVLVPDLTMIATANAVRMTGAEPILVDIDAFNFCLDLTQIHDEAKAMIYVDLNGRSGDMKEVKKHCKDHNMILIVHIIHLIIKNTDILVT